MENIVGMKIGERVVGQNGLCFEWNPRVTNVRATGIALLP